MTPAAVGPPVLQSAIRNAKSEIGPWLDRLHSAAKSLPHPIAFMEVCGTHTMEAFRCGLHSLMPVNVSLLSGPGCPVCVTAQGDIDALIDLAFVSGGPHVTVCTYGDMLRVPGRRGSLELARSQGADVRSVYSILDAVNLATQEPARQVVFAAVGFETTAPLTAAGLLAARQRGLANFSVFVSHKTIIPAILALLSSEVKVAGFLCPGHVSIIIGSQAYQPVVERFRIPCVIAGFEPVLMAAGLARLTEQARDGQAALENLYPQAVTPAGNTAAQAMIAKVFQPAPAMWRGLGPIAGSGLQLRAEFRGFDALTRFGVAPIDAPEPAGCRCGQVITGRATPHDCPLFATTCTPVSPVGPCMVSSEGTCQAYFKYRRMTSAKGACGM